MKPRVAFLSAPHYCEYIKQLMQYYGFNFNDLCDLDFYEYNLIAELPELYRRIYDQYDGFCVTGNFTKELILQLTSFSGKPIQSIYAHSLEYFKEFFYLVNENRSIDFKRVVTDFSLWLGNRTSLPIPSNVDEFINVNRRFADLQTQLLEYVSTDDILKAEQNIITNASALFAEGNADHIVCRFATAYRKLQEKGIPCSFVYPASDTVVDTFQLLISDIRLAQMDSDLPAVLYVTSDALLSDGLTSINSNNLSIQQSLLEFDQENTAGLVIRQAPHCYEIYTTQQIVKNITDNFTNCRLRAFIFSRTGIETQIGYGIGANVMKARNNASAASKIAQRNHKSYLINQSEALVGPLEASNSTSDTKEVTPGILQAASDSRLSLSTIQRILSATEMLGTKELTTQDLASSLQVTAANANRFLNTLLKSGYAEIVSEKKSYSKGRPSRIYKILL